VFLFGRAGRGQTHLAITLGRAIIEARHSILFTSATALPAALGRAETEGQLADRLLFCSKPNWINAERRPHCALRARPVSARST
jgi:DNA replication protein DnaC